ncbi:MAG TPA: PilZ domain-containing protein [Kofleriaceae bacterium]|nr:PilZ domain-containing protein [Kofleriaceae bacterium]
MQADLGTTHGRPRRVDVRVPVDILASKGIRLTGKTRNVSEGGMFVETALLLPVGSPVRCDLALERSAIEVFGRIAWSRPRQPFACGGMGIQFVGYEDGARRVLRDVVDAGVPIVRMELREVTAQIARPRGQSALLVALFAGVALVTAWIVSVVLP